MLAFRLDPSATRRMLCAALALVVLAAGCGMEPVDGPRRRVLLLEGDVVDVLGAHGFRVGTAADGDGGVLVLAVARPRLRRLDRVKVVGLQHVLRVRQLERTLGIELDRYRPYEGEEVIVAQTVEVTARRRASRRRTHTARSTVTGS